MKAPIKGFIAKAYPTGHISQFFGEHPELYGSPSMQNPMAGHNGIDIVAPWGTPILSVEDGEVVQVFAEKNGYGNHIRILSNGNEWVYGHLSRMDVKVGQLVKAGQQIGLMGNTGFVVSGATPYWKYNPYAGTHLHLGLRKYRPDVNGFQYASKTPKIAILNYENGFLGSVDFLPILESIAAPTPAVPTPQITDGPAKAPTAVQLTILGLLRQVFGKLLELRKVQSQSVTH